MLLLRPIDIETAMPMVSSAMKKTRPSSPIVAPMSSSDAIRRRKEIGAPAASGRKSSACIGVKASDSATAMNKRTCTGMRGLEKPGISIRQAPTRLNTTKATRT